MKTKLFFCIITFNIIFAFSLKNMVFANSYGEEINFLFYDNKESALDTFNNSVWIEAVNGGYDIKYDAYTNIAGFQFEFDNLDNAKEFKLINGQVKDNKFTLKVKTSSSTGVYYRSGGGDITIMEIQG